MSDREDLMQADISPKIIVCTVVASKSSWLNVTLIDDSDFKVFRFDDSVTSLQGLAVRESKDQLEAVIYNTY
jgi:hypothetical protein